MAIFVYALLVEVTCGVTPITHVSSLFLSLSILVVIPVATASDKTPGRLICTDVHRHRENIYNTARTLHKIINESRDF